MISTRFHYDYIMISTRFQHDYFLISEMSIGDRLRTAAIDTGRDSL
jgi:hypothetical protein